MSEYKDFVRDFPLRCHDLLKKFEPGAKLRDREVMLLLAVASAGLVVPYEGLRPERPHPSGDVDIAPNYYPILSSLQRLDLPCRAG
jgi:hypothetical protein